MERIKGLFAAIRTYFREVVGELKKVTWPTINRTIRLTGVVAGMVFLVAGFLYILDYPLGVSMTKVFGR